MDQLARYFDQYPLITSLLFGLCVFLLFQSNVGKLLNKVQVNSKGRKDEALKYMKLMSSEMDENKLHKSMMSLSVAFGFIFFFLLWPNFVVGLGLGFVGAYLGWAIIPIFLKSQYEKRCDQFVIQMVDALTIMANGVKSGSSPLQSMQRLVENMSNPISKEFQIVISQHQFGQSLEDSLNDLAKRIPRPDVEMFVTAINILKETGGNMSETFQPIVVTIRERQKVEMKIEAMIRQRLLTGYILTSIPFLVGLILYVMFPNLMMPMFNQPMGLVLLGVVIVMTIIGGIWIKKIVTIKV